MVDSDSVSTRRASRDPSGGVAMGPRPMAGVARDDFFDDRNRSQPAPGYCPAPAGNATGFSLSEESGAATLPVSLEATVVGTEAPPWQEITHTS